MKQRITYVLAALTLASAGTGCTDEAEGLALAGPADTTVMMDFFAKPLPAIALPNDIATRYDGASATGRRVNASMVATTGFEELTRRRLDQLDGWGVLQAITVPFTAPIDVMSVRDRHDDADYDTADDAIYVVNIDRDSPNYGAIHHLDFGNGNFPVVLERRDLYWKNDPRGESMSLFFEEADEDLNRNGVLDAGEDRNGNQQLDPGEDLDGDGKLDPPEDTDADGVLDSPNYLPGARPAWDDLAGRTDALMTFYEKSTNTLIGRPLVPFDDRTTYAVIVTRRILDQAGKPIGSPYPYINHTGQTEDLKPLLDVLPKGISLEDIAFTYPFTTQTIRADWQAVRDGLYGYGTQAHLATEFPPRIDEILPMRDAAAFPGMTMPHLMYGETWAPALTKISNEILGASEGTLLSNVIDGTGYVDFYTIGRFSSPQLFEREASVGVPLPYNDQVWPQDLDQIPVDARPEDIFYTLAIPRKETSVRGEGKQAPVIVLGHGYQANRFDVMQFSSYFAAHGFAVIGIDGPGHGVSISKGDEFLAQALLAGQGMGQAGIALLSDRATDLNFDGVRDSGADFWTSYLFHTRDMVRQFALDYMQLVRLVKSFDGQRRWAHDVDGDGQPELAGDFDADGVVDIGADSPIYAFGGSLGGIMSMVLGAVEPNIDAIAPVSGGGGYGDLGPRSTQGGVYQGFILRVMGPLFVGDTDPDTGDMLIETIVVDINTDETFPLATVKDVRPWDTMLVENLRNGVRRCAFVQPDGTVRASSETNIGDRLRITFYRGPQIVAGSEECELMAGAKSYAVIDEFTELLTFRGEGVLPGEPLVAMMEGLGMRRGHSDFRRLGGLAQLVLDPSDPAVLARHLLIDPLYFPGSGETTGAHSLIITTMGDSAVPVGGGVTVGRAAGLIDYLTPDARYGKPVNQVLIDTYTTEGVDNLNRYLDPNGNGVHLDIENFAEGDDLYGDTIPRFAQPLRLGLGETDTLGGASAAIFPYNVPTGQHGFDLPGGMTDKAREQCREACSVEGEDDPCSCEDLQTFDIGFFMMNMIGRYFKSGGLKLDADLCQSRNDCQGLPSLPPARDISKLP